MWFWDAVASLPIGTLIFFFIALVIAFGFEFINGFHDTANAVTTVIYTRSLKPTPAVLYSGFMNFLGVLVGGTAVAFTIVNLLPVDLLIDANTSRALLMVLSLLLGGVIWNLGTWYLGLPVSSSHTLIGSIIGVGLAHGLIGGLGLGGVGWSAVWKAGLALLISPIVGFAFSALLLLVMKRLVREPKLYKPPEGDDKPPRWIRAVLIFTCGGVSFAHGSNDGQKGMGLILLVLIGFLPFQYALNTDHPKQVAALVEALPKAKELIAEKLERDPVFRKEFDSLTEMLAGKESFVEIPKDNRWMVRVAIYRIHQALPKTDEGKQLDKVFRDSIEFVPFWVIFGVALALGVGTTVGYKRIVITVAEKIGKTHLTYGQGAAAETVAALTILAADMLEAPVSTTQVLSSGIAGTMAANGSGVQASTCKKILIAWVLTLPSTIVLAGSLFAIGRIFI